MKLDVDSINKINKLAATLRNTGLASNMQEAVEKAKEIVLGKDRPLDADEVMKEVDQVESELREDLKSDGIYFSDGSEDEEEPVELEVYDEPSENPVEEESAKEGLSEKKPEEPEQEEEQPAEESREEEKPAHLDQGHPSYDVTKEKKTVEELFSDEPDDDSDDEEPEGEKE
ncbi:MAG: hypothetical protein V1837_01210 [Candidatus Woesearchaeota archaeon]